MREEGTFTGYYRSNGENWGGSFNEGIASEHFSFGYVGAFATTDDYSGGAGHKVTSIYAHVGRARTMRSLWRRRADATSSSRPGVVQSRLSDSLLPAEPLPGLAGSTRRRGFVARLSPRWSILQ